MKRQYHEPTIAYMEQIKQFDWYPGNLFWLSICRATNKIFRCFDTRVYHQFRNFLILTGFKRVTRLSITLFTKYSVIYMEDSMCESYEK